MKIIQRLKDARALHAALSTYRIFTVALVAGLLSLTCAQSFGALAQQAYVKASNPGAGDQFGATVAISGDTMIVGAPQESSNATGVNGAETNDAAFWSGAAYIYVRSGTNWTQQAYLKASDSSFYLFFGSAVAIDGNTAVVGAPSASSGGAAYVFVRSGTNWTEQRLLKASNDGGGFGGAVSVSGNTVVIGAKLEGSDALGVNGVETNYTSLNSGAAYVFVRNGTAWSQQAYLKASNADPGDQFGGAVGVAGDTIVVGAREERSIATGVDGDQGDNSSIPGAAYVFVRSGTNWTQQAYLKASNSGFLDGFGSSVAVSGNTIVVGAPEEDSSTVGSNGDPFLEDAFASGAAYVFFRNGAAWSQQAYLKASNTGAGDRFGNAVAVDGDSLVVGASREDSNGLQANNTTFNSGAAYLYARLGTNWNQQAYLKALFPGGGFYDLDTGDAFGTSVGISGGTTVAGAPNEGSTATGVNGDQSNNSLSQAGAAYVFVPAAASSGYVSTPAPGSHLDFGLVHNSTSTTLFIGNSGQRPLLITQISYVEATWSNRFDVSLPASIVTGGTLEVTVPFGSDEGELGALSLTLRVVCDDPVTPVVDYPVTGTHSTYIGHNFESTELRLFAQLLGFRNTTSKSLPVLPQTLTFGMNMNSAHHLTTEIPPFLGGGSVTLSNFTGSATVSASPIPNDTNRAFLRVESGSFTAPSFTLPSGLASGPNVLTFGPPEQSSGLLYLTNGHYEVTATATITNSLIPNGVTVRGNYTGTYNFETEEANLQSDSRDLFVASERVQLNHAPNGLWLTWANTNAVEEATDVTGPWRPVTNAVSPYLVITTNLPQQFFRLRLPPAL
jgi:FG-GAP repeat